MLTFFRCKAQVEMELGCREYDEKGILLAENPEKQNLAARVDMARQIREALEKEIGKYYGNNSTIDVNVTECEFIQYDRKSVEKENT